jgi:hypothetical protein
MRPASSLEEPAPGGDEGCVAPPTATGVAGGVTPGLGVGDPLVECPGEVDLALGRGVAGRAVGAEVGLGVGRTVGDGDGVAASVTVMLPPGADVPSEPMKVTVQVPEEETRADLVQVEPVAGGLSPIESVAPLRVKRAMTVEGLGLPESTRKEKSVLVVPLRGLTDPLVRLRLARMGLATATSDRAAINSAIPELRTARRRWALAVDAAAGKRVVPRDFVRGSLGGGCRGPQ